MLELSNTGIFYPELIALLLYEVCLVDNDRTYATIKDGI